MEENIYQSHDSEILFNNSNLKRYSLGKKLAIVGSIIQIFVILGFISFLFSLIELFYAINLYGTGDPKVMAGGISEALTKSLVGCFVPLTGLIISSIALFVSDYRSKPFFLYSIFVSIFWLLSFPWGTVFGLIFLILVIKKRKVFVSSEAED
ncbi:MAG: MotA/TolQ/ExbB proton channel family protein [Gammaproteobacteria bacterium]|nr:MotA/TolQ/ExbB proton channel family protein [Gammaproteobacteria bacterium]